MVFSVRKIKYVGIALSGLGLLSMIIGIVLHELMVNNSPDIPIYSPFLEFFRFSVLVGGLAILYANLKTKDEFLERLNLLSFKYTLGITSVIVVINQLFYFFTDNLVIVAIDLVILQVWLQYFMYYLLLKRAES